jgi:hypothetical protein
MGYSFTFNFSEKDIDFSPKSGRFFNYQKFIINEFFNSSDDEMLVIMTEYKKYYGDSSYKYVLKNYYWGWRNGNRTLSNVQEDRILKIMPKFLNADAIKRLNEIKEEARYKLGIEEILGAIKRTVTFFFQNNRTIYAKEKIFSESDILNIFQKEIDRVKQLQLQQQIAYNRVEDFYILNDEEKKEALQIAQYIVCVKLKKMFDQIEKDFNTFLPFMLSIKRGIFTATYYILKFNLNVDLTKINFHKIEVPKFLIEEIEANSRFKEYSDKYLAYELVTIHIEGNKAISSAFLNANDIKLFFDHYEELSHSDSEIDMKSKFDGEGGWLSIQVSMKPIKMFKRLIAKSLVIMTIYIIIILGLVCLIFNYKWYPLIIFVGTFSFLPFHSEFEKIKNLKIELKKYGQQ